MPALRRRIGTLALCLTAFITSIDVFVLLLALPAIGRDLGASAIELLWITDVYGFVLVGFMLTAGTLGDRIGRRRLLLIGSVMFAVASIVAAFAETPSTLIAARAVLGLAGSTLAPTSLALISSMFHDPRTRASAISLWQLCFMGGALIGPILGGVVLEYLWPGSVFLLGVPAMLLLLAVAPWAIPESKDASAGSLDLVSVGLCLGMILPTIYALKEFVSAGANILPLVMIVVGVACGIAFVARQRRIEDPLLDVRLFADRRFTAIVVIMVLLTTLSSLTYFVTQFLQLVRDMTPLGVAFALVPAAVTSLIGIAAAPPLARLMRPAFVIAGGMLVAASGAVLIGIASSLVQDEGIATWTILGLALVTLGNSPAVTLGTVMILETAPPARAGSGAAIAETGTELGFSLGIAVLGSVALVAYRSALRLPEGTSSDIIERSRDGLGGAIATGLPEVIDAGREAFTSSLGAAVIVGAGIALTIGSLALFFLRTIPHLSREMRSDQQGQLAQD